MVLPVKYYGFYILLSLSFFSFGCITTSNLKKAKLERKSLTVNAVLSSNIDVDGVANINFTSQGKKYQLRVPLDSIIRIFNRIGGLEYRNPDTSSVFVGVDYEEKKYLILYKLSALLEITDARTNAKNDSIFTVYKDKVFMSNNVLDSTVEIQGTATSIKTFVFQYAGSDTIAAYRKNRANYLITLIPEQKKKGRYFLLPLTVTADIVTLPLQGLALGFTALLAWAMRF